MSPSLAATFAVALVCLLSLSQAQPHPFSVHDMIELDRVGTPVLSPSGSRALFTRWTYDFATSRSSQSIWITELTGSGNVSVPVTASPVGSSDFSPVWLDNSNIAFLSASRTSATVQVFTTAVSGGASPAQLTNFPIGIDTIKVFTKQGVRMLGFTARVYPSSSLQETKDIDEQKAKDPSSALAYDRLYFRHWDTFSDHKYSHLFVIPFAQDSLGGYSVVADPVDLLFGLELETPVAPFGGDTDYDFSPDGFEAAFAALRPGLDQAWSTDTNIYLVNTTGVAPPVAITEANRAQDSLPLYSNDGNTIAYLAMRVCFFSSSFSAQKVVNCPLPNRFLSTRLTAGALLSITVPPRCIPP